MKNFNTKHAQNKIQPKPEHNNKTRTETQLQSNPRLCNTYKNEDFQSASAVDLGQPRKPKRKDVRALAAAKYNRESKQTTGCSVHYGTCCCTVRHDRFGTFEHTTCRAHKEISPHACLHDIRF